MAKITSIYPEKWLKAKHLQGKATRATVSAATVEHLYNPRTRSKEARFVVRFQGKQLALVLNKTQALALAHITGSDDSDDWAGHEVILSPAIAPNGQPTIQLGPVPAHS